MFTSPVCSIVHRAASRVMGPHNSSRSIPVPVSTTVHHMGILFPVAAEEIVEHSGTPSIPASLHRVLRTVCMKEINDF
jgi:hypothetical protein